METAGLWIKRFFLDLWNAAIFAIGEYDVKLQATKSITERIYIWASIALLFAFILAACVYGIWTILDSFPVEKFT